MSSQSYLLNSQNLPILPNVVASEVVLSTQQGTKPSANLSTDTLLNSQGVPIVETIPEQIQLPPTVLHSQQEQITAIVTDMSAGITTLHAAIYDLETKIDRMNASLGELRQLAGINIPTYRNRLNKKRFHFQQTRTVEPYQKVEQL